MRGERYRIASLIDMARVPPEAWAKLCEELPFVLAAIAPIVAAYDAARASGHDVPQSKYDDLLVKADWIDDEKREVAVEWHAMREGHLTSVSKQHFQMPPKSEA